MRFIRLSLIVLLVLTTWSNSVSAEGMFDLRVIGQISVQQFASTDDLQGTVLVCQDVEKAGYCAAKFYTDILSYGTAAVVDNFPGLIKLADDSFCRIAQDDKLVYLLFGQDPDPLRQAGSATWVTPTIRQYPRWLDRFDNDAAGMAFLGWGDKPADLDNDFRWARQYFSRFLLSGTSEADYIAPGIHNFASSDWWATIGEKYDAAIDIYLESALSARPLFPLNIHPLPHIPQDGNNSYSSDSARGRLMYSQLTDIDTTDVYEEAALTSFAKYMRQYDRYSGYFAAPEIGQTALPFLSAIKNAPETWRAWRSFLQEEKGYSLTDLGKKHYDNPNKFTSWDKVTLPLYSDFIKAGAVAYLDLKNENWQFRIDAELVGEEQKYYAETDIVWPIQGNPGDGKFQVYNYVGRGVKKNHIWAKYEFVLTEQQASQLKFLHQEPNFWHKPRYTLLKVWLNGQETQRLTKTSGTPVDFDDCFALDQLKIGKNVIIMQSLDQPAPGYLFLSSNGRWSYPATDLALNRRYFDAVEFVAHLRVSHVEKRMCSFLRGDPDGRPQLIMACDSLFDLLIPVMKKYGGFPHDTGMMTVTYCPWTTAYGVPHGLPISGEPGISPSTEAELKRNICMWTALGVESVNLLWAPTPYRDKDNGATGRRIEQDRELIKSWGKLEYPDLKIAVTRSIRNASRLNLLAGWNWDVTRGTLQEVGRRGQVVDLADLANRIADRYPVIFDAASQLLTEEEIDNIERYVRNGGIFIATHLTGMHSPEKFSSWPISRLTGVKPVTNLLQVDKSITFGLEQQLWPSLRGKTVPSRGYAFDYVGVDHRGDEIALQAVTSDIETIATWDSIASKIDQKTSNIAIASRRIGQGRIIVLGSSFWRQARDNYGSWRHSPESAKYLDELFHSLNIVRTSTVVPAGKQVFAEKWLSKNGLYNIFMVSRPAGKVETEDFSVTFHVQPPQKLYDYSVPGFPEVDFVVNAPDTDSVVGSTAVSFTIPNLKLQPYDVKIFAAPVSDPENAPQRWLSSLSRRWSALPELGINAAHTVTQTPSPWIIPLDKDWLAQQLPSDDQVSDQNHAQDVSNSQLTSQTEGKPVNLGLFATMGFAADAKVCFTKALVLPENWLQRRLQLVFKAGDWHYWGIRPQPEIFVNNEKLPLDFSRERTSQSIDLIIPSDGKLNFTLIIDGNKPFEPVKRKYRPVGVSGLFYLVANPEPLESIPLDNWNAAMGLEQLTPVAAGETVKFRFLEQKFTLPDSWGSDKIFLEFTSGYPILGWLEINGQVIEDKVWPFNQLLVSGLVNPPGQENVIRWGPDEPWRTYINDSRIFAIPVPVARLAVWPDLPYAPGIDK